LRYVAQVQYRGTNYKGWQLQPSQITVQRCVEVALSKVANHPIRVVIAGRTDAGVHAIRQTLHFESDALRTTENWLQGGNANLPKDIALLWISEVSANFHARNSAISREYLYFIDNAAIRRPLFFERSWQVATKLDIAQMQAGCQRLIGKYDFSSFRSRGCQAIDPIKTIEQFDICCQGQLLRIYIKADSFLYNMVRNLVAFIVLIGKNQRQVAEIPIVIQAKARKQAANTAPASGLYFLQANYAAKYGIPQQDLNIWI